ncbi:hypothetical protein JTE90_000873 [Oedothorax gibbosus]|uniref:Uncharacterized protein n=1 Tax=Oedothorax gibbosus TaxID=931172 RepID=A0AAV6VTF1_9ARAC|nr:hypothetical protein JTE90_000873 [Oedothorax gibbosus]
MSFLGKGKKQDLLVICEELGEELDHLSKVPEIKKVIVGSESYDEIEVKVMLDRIIEERLRNEENEKQEAREKRKLELESEESKRKIELESTSSISRNAREALRFMDNSMYDGRNRLIIQHAFQVAELEKLNPLPGRNNDDRALDYCLHLKREEHEFDFT